MKGKQIIFIVNKHIHLIKNLGKVHEGEGIYKEIIYKYRKKG